MKKGKKKPQQATTLKVALVTALIQLIKAIIELINKLNE